MRAKYEVSFSYCSKVIAKVEVERRQTGHNNMPQLFESGTQSLLRLDTKVGQGQRPSQDATKWYTKEYRFYMQILPVSKTNNLEWLE